MLTFDSPHLVTDFKVIHTHITTHTHTHTVYHFDSAVILGVRLVIFFVILVTKICVDVFKCTITCGCIKDIFFQLSTDMCVTNAFFFSFLVSL